MVSLGRTHTTYIHSQLTTFTRAVRSLLMAASLMTQWLFNFVIAKLTPLMLAQITYGTFLLFGSCCAIMLLYAVFCVPETKGVPLESIGLLFEGNIIAGATRDTCSGARARRLREHHGAAGGLRAGQSGIGKLVDDGEGEGEAVGHYEDAR